MIVMVRSWYIQAILCSPIMIMQVEHCEDALASESSFKHMADKAAGPLETTHLYTLHVYVLKMTFPMVVGGCGDVVL